MIIFGLLEVLYQIDGTTTNIIVDSSLNNGNQLKDAFDILKTRITT